MEADFPRRFGQLIRQSLGDPAGVARFLIGLNLSRAVLWQALVLVTVVSVLLVALTQGAVPEGPPGPGGGGPLVLSPFTYAVILGSSLVLLVFALHFTGAGLGGTGDFGAALVLIVWLEVLAMTFRVFVAAVALLLPAVSGIASALGLGLLVWILVNFINVMHGFESLWKAAFTLLIALVGISIGVTMFLTLIGVGATGGLGRV